jgi:aromatic ring-cleaving dioxygenase
MAEPADIGVIADYHAHVYFDEASKEAAWALREAVLERFDIEMGRFHERLVGPHPRWSFQIAFKPELFAAIVPWLMLNRGELIVFLHPNTDDDMKDHRDFPVFMGGMPQLNLGIFERKS